MSAVPVTSLIELATREGIGEALTFDALCDALAARNILLDKQAARAGRLAYHAPAGVVTPDLRAALALHKPALLAALTAPAPAGPLPPHPQCAWGKPHYQAWDYHAGWRTLICAICYPQAWNVPPMPPTPPAEAWPDWPAHAADSAASDGASAPTPPGNARQRPTPTPPPDAPTDAPVKPSPRGGSSRAADRGPDRLAVLDASGDTVCMWVERPHTVGAPTVERVRLAPEDAPTPGACNAGALLALAARLDVAQLWIHPSWAQLAGLPARAATREERREGIAHPFVSEAPAGGWDIQPARLAPWLVGLRRGVYGRYVLAFPQLDTRVAWRHAPDGETLLRALLAYRAALDGYGYWRSPGASATGLLKRLHASEHALDLSASMTPLDFPPPARKPATVTDMAWIRPLDGRELALAASGEAYVHGYDKHAMYLGAASALWVGMGVARHVASSTGASGELAGLVARAATKDRTPGYWLASIAYDPPSGMPNPFADTLTPGADRPAWRADAPRWIATPTLDLALSLGARVDVREAWVWSERHRALETWRNTLRDAREALHRAASGLPDTSAPALALAALKATYTQGIGWLDGGWLRTSSEPEDLYRPDWRHAVMAQALANFYRNGLAVYTAHGLAPIAAYTDAWYYVLADADAARACPSTDKVMRLDRESLAGWSVKASAPLVTVRASLDALAALPSPRGASARRIWQDVMRALHPTEDATENETEDTTESEA